MNNKVKGKFAGNFLKHYNQLVDFSLDKIEKVDIHSAGTIQGLRNQLNIWCSNVSTAKYEVCELGGPKLLENKDIIINNDSRGFLKLDLMKYSENAPDEYKEIFELESAIKKGFKIANETERALAFEIVRKMLLSYIEYIGN